MSLDEELLELRWDGAPVPLQPKVLELLLYLIRNRDRVVSKRELLDSVWADAVVAEGALTRAVNLARRAVGDAGREQRVIRTYPRRGYRFCAAVEARREVAGGAAPGPEHAPLVGRARELSEGRDALERALAGRGQVLVLSGEPGIGKTRLAEELTASATALGARVLWGRSTQVEGEPAYWPWIQILRAYVAGQEPRALHEHMGLGAADIAEIVPEVRERLPELPVAPRLDPEQARFRFFDSACGLFRGAAAAGPIVLVLEDLHWADAGSLMLLEFLARETRGDRVLAIGTYRDVELSRQHPLRATLAELARNEGCRALRLEGLGREDVGPFVERLAGIEAPPGLVDDLHVRTGGNPLFLRELVQWLRARGVLDAERWDGAWEPGVPEGVVQAIDSRLRGLSEPTNRVLRAASVIGEAFALHVLSRSSGMPERELLARLEEACAAGILAEDRAAPGHFRFSHALVRAVLYEGLGAGARAALHRATALALEELYTPRPLVRVAPAVDIEGSPLAELAHHFGEAVLAGEADKAIFYSIRAGEYATSVLAFEEAVRQFERALRVVEASGAQGDLRHGRLLLSLAAALHRAGERDRAADRAWQAIGIARAARATGRAELLTEAATWLAANRIGGRFMVEEPERVAALEEGLAALGDADSARAEAHAATALAMARRVGDRATLWQVLYLERLSLLEPGADRERRAADEEAVRLARELGDPEREHLSRMSMRLPRLIEEARPIEVDAELDACVAYARELRQPSFLWAATRATAARALWQGRLAEAEEAMEEALAIGRRADETEVVLSYHSQLLWLRRVQGRFAELETALRRVSVLSFDRGHKAAALALLLVETGRDAEARDLFEGLAADSFARLRRDSNYAYNLALLAETCARLGDEEHAAELDALLAPYGERWIAIPLTVAAGSAARYRGLLAVTRGRLGEAAAHFEAARAVERRMGAPPHEAYVCRDWARVLRKRDASGDREAARRLLERTRDIARRLDLAGLAGGD